MLRVTGDRVAAIQADLPRSGAKRVIDVAGCYVTPGLIDFHVHSYWGVNPYGCNLDSLCLATGVTTTMDAGSAGPVNFLGFRKLVYEQSKTRMLGFIALAQHGVLNTPGELLNLGFADSDGAAEAVGNNRDIGVGIKVRLHKKSIGENSREALRLAIKAGEATRTPIMVHVGDTAIGMDEIADTLRPGDIITHCYTPQKPSIIDDKGKLLPLVRKAKERGVIFDVGHAGGHFDFNLVQRAMGEGIIARCHQLGPAWPLEPARFRRGRRFADGADEVFADGFELRTDHRKLHGQRRSRDRLARSHRQSGSRTGSGHRRAANSRRSGNAAGFCRRRKAASTADRGEMDDSRGRSVSRPWLV